MSSRARRTRRPSEAAAAAASQLQHDSMSDGNPEEDDDNGNHNHNNDNISVASSDAGGSKASRSSARLKRKRDSAAATLTQPAPHIPEGQRPPRSAKRQRTHKPPLTPNRPKQNSSTVKKKKGTTKGDEEELAAHSEEEEEDDDDDQSDNNHEKQLAIPTEIETKPDNGHNDNNHKQQQQQELSLVDSMEEDEDDGKQPAAGENGHASASRVASAVENVVVPLVRSVEAIPMATASIIAPVPRQEPLLSSQSPPQQQPPPAVEARVNAERPVTVAQVHEPEENGQAAAAGLEPRAWEWAGPLWTILYETTTAAVIVTSDTVLQLWERALRRTDDSDTEMVEEAVGVPVPEEILRPTRPSPWDRTGSWIILFLFLQVLGFALRLNPVLSQTAAFSDVLLKLYSRGRRGTASARSTTVEMSLPVANDYPDDRIQEQLSRLQQRQAELENLLDIRDAAQAKVDHLVEVLQETLTDQRERFSEAHTVVEAALQDLQVLVAMDTDAMLQSPQFSSLLAHWNQSGDHSTIPLIDMRRLELWKIVNMDSDEDDDSVCASNLVGDKDSDASGSNQLDEFLKSLYAKASEVAAAVQEQPTMISSVRQWIRATLQNETGMVWNDSDDSMQSYGKNSGVGSDMARLVRLLQLRLEEEMADQTGTWDYASISNGAQVIQTKTSPSLVDSMPIINRIGALLGLRFYGHGPEAALTPTHPPYALGQCWSFLDQTMNDHTTDSMLGVLTVRLARPIVVESVLIEHPPEDVAQNRVRSAIRAFHVKGYEEADASGEAWDLGSFEFKIGSGASSRQEFDVSHGDDDDEDVPVFRAVRLQIESNWGGEYACLYRFRVHGYAEEEVHGYAAEEHDDDSG